MRILIKAVVFDLDGTLIDSVGDIHAAIAKILRARGVTPLDLATVRGFIGKGSANLVMRCLDAVNLPKDKTSHAAALEDFLAVYTAGSAQMTTLFNGVVGSLTSLKKSGYRLAICTNKPLHPTQIVLDQFGLASFFDAVVGGDQLATRKPDPEMLDHAVELLQAKMCLFVGDSEIDRATAIASGQPFALFTKGYRQTSVEDLSPDYQFDEFADLPGLVTSHFVSSKSTGCLAG